MNLFVGLNPLLLFAIICSIDLAVSAGKAKNIVRTIAYIVASIVLVIAGVLALVH